MGKTGLGATLRVRGIPLALEIQRSCILKSRRGWVKFRSGGSGVGEGLRVGCDTGGCSLPHRVPAADEVEGKGEQAAGSSEEAVAARLG